MFNLETLIRPNILALKPYSSARDEYTGKSAVFLDANENPYGKLNRYPDPYQKDLKRELAHLKNVSSSDIFIGNGSDEVIDLAFRIFCNPGKDKALTFSPTYGMYDVSAAINDVELMKIPLNENFEIEIELIHKYLNVNELKIIFICSPNNPTGNSINVKAIEYILQNFKGIVIVDEAYIDFSPWDSWAQSLKKYPNLIVSQTFSKAWGLAAARVGVAFASEAIIQLFNKVKPPYNVSQLNQEAALKALSNRVFFEENRQIILKEKAKLEKALNQMPKVEKIYYSDANFLLIKVDSANELYRYLINQKVVIRNRNALVKNCIRISIGTPEENKVLLEAMIKYFN